MLIIDGTNFKSVGSACCSGKEVSVQWTSPDKPEILPSYPDMATFERAIQRTNHYYLVSPKDYQGAENEPQRIAKVIIEVHRQSQS